MLLQLCTHRALFLVLEDKQACCKAATEHQELPACQLLHLHFLPSLVVIMQHFPVGHVLHS